MGDPTSAIVAHKDNDKFLCERVTRKRGVRKMCPRVYLSLPKEREGVTLIGIKYGKLISDRISHKSW